MAVFVVVAVLLLGVGFAAYWTTHMPARSFRDPLPTFTAEEQASAGRLRAHLNVLAGEIGERNLGRYDAMLKAEAYLQRELEALGLRVNREEFQVGEYRVANLFVNIRGTSRPEEWIVVGGHYDTVPGGPGANDNGTGAVALLELARLALADPPQRSVRLVAFANEENPYFGTDGMGSWVHAKGCRARQEQIAAMISVETIGYFSDEPKSQRYPFPLGYLYPDTGNFIAFVSNVKNRELVHRCIRAFRHTTFFPSEGGALPGNLPGVGWSDHWAFWQEGCPAVMVTDTALFRDPHYHTPEDLPERLDMQRLARVVRGLGAVILDLAGDGNPRSLNEQES